MFILLHTLSLLVTAPPAPVEIRTLAGETIAAQLVELEPDKLTIEVNGQPRPLPLAQLQQVTFDNKPRAAATPKIWVELRDGSVLAADEYSVHSDTAHVALTGDKPLELPVRSIRTVRFKEQTPDQHGEWLEILQLPTRTDLIVIRKDDHIDSIAGVVRDIGDDAVQFELEGQPIPVKLEKVEGLVYHESTPAQLPPSTFRVTDIDGTELEGAGWTATESGVRFQSPLGVEITRSFVQLRHIDFSADKIIFLSDLKPRAMTWMPYFEAAKLSETLAQFYRPKMDRALTRSDSASDDGKLQLLAAGGGQPVPETFEKGIAMHSRSSLVFDLPDDVRQFRATAGIDFRVRDHGNVRLVIRGDGRELYAENIAGADPPRELSVNIAGVRQLELFVDYGENLDIGDHLNLCNARLVK